ncbi:MAG TPA: c-type cytochrome biogenesis protein CcsB [Marmoricola sp.]|nr:c-type cytochrome biogenesis protein CcsB [Marmoricola sp.]HMY08851.1 c-type cytochrome biogenesis protein CcsB [Marmoricola sp.]
MTKMQFEAISDQAIAGAGVVYFLAALATLAAWAAGRKVVAASAREAVMVGAGASAESTPEPVVGDADKMDLWSRIGLSLTILAAGIHLIALVTRGLAADPVRVPWGNMYEFTITSTWVVVAGYLLLFKRYSLSWLAPIVTWFAVIMLMVSVLVLYQPVTPLRDALQSYWLVIHVIAAIVATGAFTIGGMCSMLYLIKARWEEKQAAREDKGGSRGGYLARLPSLKSLDQMAYRTHAFGFPVWTFAALIAGPIWAHAAWGRYWNWDPKEVWAFVTWVVYAAYLHARATAGWKGKAAAIVALIGLATLWFNFVGINFFFGSGSMHSYA